MCFQSAAARGGPEMGEEKKSNYIKKIVPDVLVHYCAVCFYACYESGGLFVHLHFERFAGAQ